MKSIQVKPDYGRSNRIALRVALPWRPDDYLLLRLPEAISHRTGFLFCEWNGSGAWPDAAPFALPEWQYAEDGSGLGYTCELANGSRFYVRVKPGRDELDMVAGIENRTGHTLRLLSASMCAVLAAAPEFCDRSLSRTCFLNGGKPQRFSNTRPDPRSLRRPPWIHCNVRGVPAPPPSKEAPWWVCEEKADDGLVFVESSDGARFAALIWGKAFAVSANSQTPCIHSNSRLGECLPGQTVEQAGRLLLYEGRRDLMCMRALDGFA